MKLLLAAVLTGTVLLTGCNKSDKPAADAKAKTSSSDDNPINAPLNYVAAEVQAKRTSERVLSMAPVAQAIQQFHVAEERFPKSLNELVNAGYLGRMPIAPPGQQIWYNPATGEVKTVAAAAPPSAAPARPMPPANTIRGFRDRLPQSGGALPPE